MGADIYFVKGKRSCYFRDSYNYTNLAWVKGLSYWGIMSDSTFNYNIPYVDDKEMIEKQKEMFLAMATITNAEIKKHVVSLYAKEANEAKKNYEKNIKVVKDIIKKDKQIVKITDPEQKKNIKELIKILIKKRDDIKEHKKFIQEADSVEWSV